MAREPDPIAEPDRSDGSPHPREVFTLLGHERAEQRYIDAKASGRMHHAWLITGPPGIGKATLAYRIARDRLGGRSLLEGSLDIPAADPVSQRIAAQGHGNLRVLRRPYDVKTKKLKKDIPVDSVRDLSKFFQSTAAQTGDWRVCLIDTADDLNRNSENGILKLLEEPPAQTLFLLLSHEPGTLLPTIRSRCMHLPLTAVSDSALSRWLSSRTDIPQEYQRAALCLSRGAPGKAIALANHMDTVLMPLRQFMGNLNGQGADMALAKSLVPVKAATARALFWDALIDTLQAQAKYVATGGSGSTGERADSEGTASWSGPFTPIEARKSAQAWIKLAETAQRAKVAEGAINLDKTAALFDILSQVRAA